MAYPTVDFKHTNSTVGMQPISEASSTQNHPLGMEVTAKDITYGEGRFKYLKGVASTAPGDVVTYESDSGTTVRAVAAGATSNGPAAVAMSAADATTKYGWYQVEGSGPVNTETVADNGVLYLTATAGKLDDVASAGELVDGIRAKAATSSGFTTCQINRPNITGLASTSSSAGYLYCTLSAAAESGNAIVVTGQVKDSSGANVAATTNVVVRTLAVTADKGDITVTTGTDKKTVNPATGENVSWILSDATGAFVVSVANNVAEATLITASAANGPVQMLALDFSLV
jgi:hypothetical protein